MTFQNTKIFEKRQENKWKFIRWNFMIFVIGEPPKSHLEHAWSSLPTLPLKAQREWNFHPLRPAQNIEIFKKAQENKQKSNTRKSTKSTSPMTLQNLENQFSQNTIKTNIKSRKTHIMTPCRHENHQNT